MIKTKKIVAFLVVEIIFAFLLFSNTNCKIYSFTGTSIPVDVKTARVQFLENKARYINPQLSPQLTDRLRQKITNQTRLIQVTSDTADFDISGYVSQYDVTTSGISAQQVATNRLTVGLTMTLANRKEPDKEPKTFSVSRSFDFSASLTLQQAEAQLIDEILRNLTDEIFNRLFSDW
jgi:outer membrane lipopolysaccharide assembly protein LptE/RlpB